MQVLMYLIVIIPLVGALLSYVQKNRNGLRIVNFVASVAMTGLALVLVYQTARHGALRYGMFYIDELSGLLLTVVSILTLTATLYSFSYMEREVVQGHLAAARLPGYYAMLNILSFTMVAVLLVENLGLMWVAVEATTLASALLVAFQLNRTAIEAAWKYVMVCTVGICFALLGTILLYYTQVNVAGSAIEALSWLQLAALSERLDPVMVKLAFIFILIGYGTKAGLAPMHTWLPDAHSQAPSPVSGLLSGSLLSCAMYVIIRNLIIVQNTLGQAFGQYLLIGFGLLSVAIAIPFILLQHDIKRLLAYSSVEHMGLITLGLGIGTPLAVYGALLHIFNHAVAKSALFYLAGDITQEYHTKHILRIRGLITAMPLTGTLFMLFIIAAVGVPPFGIFTSKMTITWASFAAGQPVLGFFILLLLSGIFAGMIFYCAKMVLGAPAQPVRKAQSGALSQIAFLLSFLIIAGAGIYLPTWFNGMLLRAAALVSGGGY
ncbi:MAG: hydrogenase 4 subunit F [Negativicutes bacterium]|nr:hydrogenase 4 subunit F [Negativicutes bacterium]